ncbi:ABC transporter permease [uncultured Modestobacter sp.]|uniref:ABC transporter permease n=1 Tax=uncultured Modestobacter sp. TaxID=380048 RepID=UPI00260C578D|nr:ABC-2 family transporter protein [uncultured Modestobacter sp.]
MAGTRTDRDLQALRLVGTFLRVGVQNELQYRTNVLFSLLQSGVAVGTSLAVLALVFSHTDSLGGWSGDELLVVMGVHVLMGGVIRSVIQPNMQQLMDDVRQGTLDFVLTKPADGQLLVSARRFEVWQVVDVLVGAALVVVAVVRLDRPVGPLAVAGFLVALLLGVVVIYSFWLLLTVLAFWIVRVDALVELFDGMYQAGRWPVSVYPGWLRFGFTFLVPLAFAITVPAEALTGRASGWLLLGAAAFTAALFAVTRFAWRVGLRHYSGASA